MDGVTVPPTSLSLLQGVADKIPNPDYAHPLIEQYVRKIIAGEMSADQGYAAIQADLNQLKQPQAAPQGMPQGQPQQSLGAPQPQQPAPVTGLPPAPVSPAPVQAPAQPPPAQAQPLGQPVAQPVPQPTPQAGPQNTALNPPQEDLSGAARNQQLGAVTSSQPAAQRPDVGPSALTQQSQSIGQNSPQNAPGSPASSPQAMPTGSDAAREAIFSMGPRMSNRDVATFMDAYAKGGRAQIEALKEQGRNNRSLSSQRTRMAIAGATVDARLQEAADRFELGKSRLSLDQQREADRVARDIEGAQLAKQKLEQAMLRFAASRNDKLALQDMKLAHDEMVARMKGIYQMSSGLGSALPETQELIEETRKNLGQATANYEAIRDYTIATKSDPNTPAPGYEQTNPKKFPTSGEKSGVKQPTRKAP